MLRRVLAWAAAALIGVALGVGSAWATLEFGRAGFIEHYGSWAHSRAAGSQAAGPYTRAIIARDGLLALSAREALYFTLYEDEEGRPLDESCVYDLSGPPLAARWWSVTLYDADNYLVRNNDHAGSIDASRIGLDSMWSVRVSPVRGNAPHWLSSRAAGRDFSLTLRVYNPHRDFRASAETLPRLTTLSCAGEA
ncbi:MAG TPA: DUF1214 domain-containing protein [Vitreimonas sp.]|uniref:DUF1214 domain-containing protein n=1 Tax=Vitreimonas sp. TaxID=3069702 RepID=UPI002D3490EA|nr:DUF1214 domain-containing protein [Vitreimonas sp.]HYD88689.1 DUF1214 domain-containing protein [Vitreimonas sp.]